MAKKGGKSKDKKDKVKAVKKPRNLYTRYELAGDALKRKNKSCPKCGPGAFLGLHQERSVCGKCGYVEFAKKEDPAQKAEA